MILNAINLDSKTVEILVETYAIRAADRTFTFQAEFAERIKQYDSPHNIDLERVLALIRKKVERLALYAVLTGGTLADPRQVAIRMIDSCIEEYYGIQKKVSAPSANPLPVPVSQRDSSEMVCEQPDRA